MSWLKRILTEGDTGRTSGDILLALVIFAGAAGPALAAGRSGWALLIVACALAAVMPFPALLAITASVWTLPLIKTNMLISDVRPDELLLICALAGAAVRVLSRRDLVMSGVERAYAIFLGAALLGGTLELALGTGVSARAMYLPLSKQLLHLLLFVLVVWLVRRQPGRLKTIAVTAVGAGVVSALLGIAQYFLRPVHSWIASVYMTLDGAFSYLYVPGGEGFRSTSAFDGNPNHFAMALMMAALFAGAMATRSQSRPARVGWMTGSVVMLAAMLFTTSRAAFLTTVLVLVIAAVVFKSRTLGGITAAWAVLFVVLPSKMPQRLLDLLGTRTPSGELIVDPSVSGRITMMSDGVAGAPSILPMHDNFYLDLYHNFGVLALLAFLWLAYVVGSRLLRAVRENPSSPGYVLGALLATAALALASFTGGFFQTQRVAELCWILVGLAFAWLSLQPRAVRSPAELVALDASARERWSVTGIVALVAMAALDVTGRIGQLGPVRFTAYQALALGMIVLVLVWARLKRVAWVRTPLDMPVFAFVLLAALSVVLAGERALALVQLASLSSSAALAALVVALIRNGRQATRVVLGTLGVAGVLGFLAVLEYRGIFALRHPVLVSMGHQIRARVTFDDPNILASFLMVAILLAVPQLLWAPLSRRVRLLGWGGVVLALGGMTATFSRGGLGGLIVGLFFTVLLLRSSKRTRRIFVLVIVVASLVVGGFVLGQRVEGENVWGIAHDASAMDRVYLVEGAVRMWLDHPLGIGLGNFPVLYPEYRDSRASLGLVESHTAYFTVLAEMGILGLAAFLWILGRFFLVVTWPVARRTQDAAIRALAVGAFAAGIAMCADAFTYSLEGSKFLWFAIGMGTAAWRISTDRRPSARAGDLQRPGPVVCHVTSAHVPTDGRILYHECRSLARRWRTVLVCRDAEPARVIQGVELLPVRRSRGRVGRWMSLRRLVALAASVDADVYHFHDPELLLAMRALARRTRVPTIYDVHEHYPDAMAAKAWIPHSMRGVASAVAERVERMAVSSFAAVVVADAALEARFSAMSRRVVRLDNFPPLDLFPTSWIVRPAEPTLLYVGSISEVRGYDDMLETLRLVREQIPDARLVLVGTPTDEVAPRLAALDDPSVIVRGPVPYGEVAAVMHDATVGLSLLRDIPKFQKNVPTKVFDYMASMLPYVASDLQPVRELTGGVGGRLVRPGDPADAARAILKLLRDPAAADEAARDGRLLVEARLNWGLPEARLFALYGDLLAPVEPGGESTSV